MLGKWELGETLTSEVPEYTSKELSAKTWPDLARLFEKPEIGDAWWCWCMHHHVESYSAPENARPRTRAERAVRNRRQKETLVRNGRAHGVIVYANREPVGWCQYGPREELPRVDHSRNYRNLAPTDENKKLWRITCFVVNKKYRKSGAASTALKSALEAIRRKGGGLHLIVIWTMSRTGIMIGSCVQARDCVVPHWACFPEANCHESPPANGRLLR